MSEATAKAARRDLRRVIGEEALDDLAHRAKAFTALERTVQHISNSLTQAHGRIDREHAEMRAVHERDLAIVGRELERVEGLWVRSFWGRLRWLLRGR